MGRIFFRACLTNVPRRAPKLPELQDWFLAASIMSGALCADSATAIATIWRRMASVGRSAILAIAALLDHPLRSAQDLPLGSPICPSWRRQVSSICLSANTFSSRKLPCSAAHRLLRPVRAAQKPHAHELLEALALRHVGLAPVRPRQPRGVDWPHLEAALLEPPHARDPAYPGGLHATCRMPCCMALMGVAPVARSRPRSIAKCGMTTHFSIISMILCPCPASCRHELQCVTH